MPQEMSTNAAHDPLDEVLTRAFRYALSLTHDRSSAEDLVQDASLAILNRGLDWDLPYVFATIRNRFIDGRRRAQRLSFVPFDDHSVAGDGEIANLSHDEPADSYQNANLSNALGKLRPSEREALYLAVVEGFTAEEIGRISKRPRGTVLSLIFRARRKLRATLEGTAPGPSIVSSMGRMRTL